jgi:hypothetical protein
MSIALSQSVSRKRHVALLLAGPCCDPRGVRRPPGAAGGASGQPEEGPAARRQRQPEADAGRVSNASGLDVFLKPI